MVDNIFNKKLRFCKFPRELGLLIFKDISNHNGWCMDGDEISESNYANYLHDMIEYSFRTIDYKKWDYKKFILFIKVIDFTIIDDDDINFAYPKIQIILYYDGMRISDVYDMYKDIEDGEYIRVEKYLF